MDFDPGFEYLACLSQLFSVARHVGRLKLRSKPANFTLDLVSYRSASNRTT